MNDTTKIIASLRYMLSGSFIVINEQKYRLISNTKKYLILTKEDRRSEMYLHNFCANCINLNDGYIKTILEIMNIKDMKIELSSTRKNLLMLFYILLKGKKFNDILMDKQYHIIQRGKLLKYYTMNKFLLTFNHFTYKELVYMRKVLL